VAHPWRLCWPYGSPGPFGSWWRASRPLRGARMIIPCRWTRTIENRLPGLHLYPDAHRVAAPSRALGRGAAPLEEANSACSRCNSSSFRAARLARWQDGSLGGPRNETSLAIIKTSVRILQKSERETANHTAPAQYRRGGAPDCARSARAPRLLPYQYDPGSGGCGNAVIHSLEPLLAPTLQSEHISLRVVLESDLPQV